MDDLISRQDAIDLLTVFTQTDALGHTPRRIVEALPAAQLPEWVQKVEQKHSEALGNPHIKNPLAWALYQTWKEYDK